MPAFHSIEELLKTLSREQRLLKELFAKRKILSFRYEDALALVDYKEERIRKLVDSEVVRENGLFLELEDSYLQFFEQILEVNEEINISFVHEHITYLKDTISYFLQENNETQRYSYLQNIKRTLRNIAVTTLRNVIDLKRNVDNTFKSEPNYKIKKQKLVRLDEKREGIEALIRTTEELINGNEEAFFCIATDEELGHITDMLRLQFYECSHNLIEIQKQIISYLNQIEYQSRILVKVRQLKYLKDQFELESKTNIREVLAAKDPVCFEPSPTYPLRLSVDYLRSGDDVVESIRKVFVRVKKNGRQAKKIAGNIAGDYLVTQTTEEIFINLEEVKNAFLASGSDLFTFVMTYHFPKEVDIDERITFYCQIISQYYDDCSVTDRYASAYGVEYTLVYPK
ncbi:hypothetical protein [Parabacteroides goldsteinii]|uniref:hypothetical protein n=1 Tax=Parabacteroides goldsteinii TaxID=328812 RepID=UPI00241DC5CF|nr:hypothetical protein [Parabacteroides goldsteinii]